MQRTPSKPPQSAGGEPIHQQSTTSITRVNSQISNLESPSRITFLEGPGELPMLEVTTPWSTAEIFLHGAHVTRFKKHGDAPLLFMSQCSRFQQGSPIRGGIPIIIPWFGFREGLGQHGIARTRAWELRDIRCSREGTVTVRFSLPQSQEASTFPPFQAEYSVSIGATLDLSLEVRNQSADQVLPLENCLHTYFEVSDSTMITITGLKGSKYLDQVEQFARKVDSEDSIRIGSEVDRLYLDTAATVEINDPQLGRVIRVEKSGSASTVVWNPWVEKSRRMPDFGDEEFQRMVCVESGNVADNTLQIAPLEKSVLQVRLVSSRLGA